MLCAVHALSKPPHAAQYRTTPIKVAVLLDVWGVGDERSLELLVLRSAHALGDTQDLVGEGGSVALDVDASDARMGVAVDVADGAHSIDAGVSENAPVVQEQHTDTFAEQEASMLSDNEAHVDELHVLHHQDDVTADEDERKSHVSASVATETDAQNPKKRKSNLFAC